MTLDTLTPRDGNATDEKRTDERLPGLREELRAELGEEAAVYHEDGDDAYVAVEADGVAAELYARDDGISVSYELDEVAGPEAAEAVRTIDEAVLPADYDAVDVEEYGPVELGPRDGETVRRPTFL